MRRVSLAAFLLVGLACTKSGQTDPGTVALPSATTSSTAGAPSASAPAATGAGACTGLEKTDCVLHPGCILDQPASGGFVCRAAANECERAVRHADVIGPDVTGVTDASASAARTTCGATAGCSVLGGKCSCTCAIFGHCNCICGGGWLPRCARTSEAASFDGFPTKP
jgi:hypothetical protein